MTNLEIFENLQEQRRLQFYAETILEENGGELTEQVQAYYDEIDTLIQTLWDEGATDELARQDALDADEEEMITSERDMFDRKVKAIKKRRERRKATLRAIIDRMPEDKQIAKGVYTIKAYDKSNTKADAEALNNLFNAEAFDKVSTFLAAHPDITIELKGSVKIANTLETMPDYYKTETYPTVKIIKPRKKNNNGTE